MIYFKTGETFREAEITGNLLDTKWGGRQTKSITLAVNYLDASALFVDDLAWSIVMQTEIPTYQTDENGEVVLVDGSPVQTGTETQTEEWDNSEYSILGDITVHTDGSVTVKMGKPTDEEMLLTLLYGGDA